ncbi:MAG: peptidase M75 [Bacteroidales bacterium]|jgi:predicted lipoprotein|nr:peptidase M75 [Bacteroidales bacterium]
MKKSNHIFFLLAICFGSLIFMSSSCEQRKLDKNNQELTDILEAYTDNTVVATYTDMADHAVLLYDFCAQMKSGTGPTTALMTSAAQEWKSTRKYWEQSEAFLYGPAEYNSLDPHIDSWPLDQNRLNQVLAQPDILTIDAAYARANFGASLLGFHAIEYVLFRDGQVRSATSLSQAELTYLCAISHVLMEDCILLEAGWRGESAISAAKKKILEDAELTISANFGNEMKRAGENGSRYLSPQQAIHEILEGCKDIADEVGNSKIADPVESGNVLEVESWQSWNSISDFVDNIISIRNSYYGGRDGVTTHSLSNYVAAKNKDLDDEIKRNIETAITKIKAIGEPFRNHLNNKTGAQEAITACDNVFLSINKIYNEIE